MNRRGFLNRLAGAAAALGLGKLPADAPAIPLNPGWDSFSPTVTVSVDTSTASWRMQMFDDAVPNFGAYALALIAERFDEWIDESIANGEIIDA